MPTTADSSQAPAAFNWSEYFSKADCKLSEASCQNSRMGFVNAGQLAVFSPGGGITN